jgi:hypothetical protein
MSGEVERICEGSGGGPLKVTILVPYQRDWGYRFKREFVPDVFTQQSSVLMPAHPRTLV